MPPAPLGPGWPPEPPLAKLEIVTGLVPQLLLNGRNPFKVDLPVTGFPAIAIQPVRRRRSLSDEFLEMVACEYLVHGRGNAGGGTLIHKRVAEKSRRRT